MGSATSSEDYKGNGDDVQSLSDEPSSISEEATIDRFQGALLGVALGDFLGFLVEGEDRAGCSQFARNVAARFTKNNEKANRIADGKSIALGQYSDDTQLTREMLQSFVDKSGFDPADYAERLKMLAKESRIVGCGLGTAKAFAKLNQGVSWDKAGSPVGSAGNGASVRAVAVGMMFCGRTKKLIKAACNQARITHQDPRCHAGAIAIATAISFVMRHRRFLAKDLLNEIEKNCFDISAEFSQSITNLRDSWLQMPLKRAIEEISRINRDFDDGSGDGVSGFVTTSVVFALLIFLKFRNSIIDCIVQSISAGGDTDSTTAMVAGLCGAFVGLQKMNEIASEALSVVTDKGTWNYDDLKDLASKAWKIRSEQPK